MRDDKPILTAGQVARICKVAARTVSKWFDSGQLNGYCIPGGRDRRIFREDLIRFMRANGLPLSWLNPRKVVLVVGAEPRLVSRLAELLPEDDGFTVTGAADPFEAGLRCTTYPAVVVVDFCLGRTESLSLARRLAGLCPVVALANEDETDSESLKAHGCRVAIQKPFDPAFLAETIKLLAACSGNGLCRRQDAP